MPYTTPRTWTAGETPTAAQLNTHLRDNMVWLATAKACRCFSTATTTVNNGAGEGFTAILFDSETYDTDTFHNTGSNTSRITIPSGLDGYYLIHGQLEYQANAVGKRDANLRKNGATSLAKNRGGNAGASAVARVGVSVVAYLAATDYVEIGGAQDSGSNLTVTAGTDLSFLEAIWLGA